MSGRNRSDDSRSRTEERAFAFIPMAGLILILVEILRRLVRTPEGQRALAVLLPVASVVGIVPHISHGFGRWVSRWLEFSRHPPETAISPKFCGRRSAIAPPEVGRVVSKPS